MAIADQAPGRKARRFVRAAQQSLDANPGLSLIDGPVPPFVIAPIFAEHARVSRAVGALPQRPRFNDSTSTPRMLDTEGHVRAMALLDVIASSGGPAPGCGWPLNTRDIEVPFEQVLAGGQWVVRVGYYASRPVRAVVRTPAEDVQVQFDVGVGYLYVVVRGPLAALEVSAGGRDVGVCITDVVAGRPWPAEPK
jgi:hypothetical protein